MSKRGSLGSSSSSHGQERRLLMLHTCSCPKESKKWNPATSMNAWKGEISCSFLMAVHTQSQEKVNIGTAIKKWEISCTWQLFPCELPLGREDYLWEEIQWQFMKDYLPGIFPVPLLYLCRDPMAWACSWTDILDAHARSRLDTEIERHATRLRTEHKKGKTDAKIHLCSVLNL